MIYAVIAALVFFCLLGIVDLNQKTAEIAELKQIKLVDCKFNKGMHSHTWKNACVVREGYVEVI
jgi:hypothetical protein